MDDEQLRETIKELRSRKLSDDFIKKQLLLREVDEKQLERILQEPANFFWAVVEKVAGFIINYFLWIFFGILIFSSVMWAIFDSLHFVKVFPLLVVVTFGSVIIGLVIKAVMYIIDSGRSNKTNQSFTKSFMLGFLFLVFIMIVGLPVDPFAWFVFITFTVIPIYLYFMVFYDLVQTEIFPLVFSALFVAYLFGFVMPYIHLFLVEVLADMLGLVVHIIDGNIYITSESTP